MPQSFDFTVALTAAESSSIKIASRGVREQWDVSFFVLAAVSCVYAENVSFVFALCLC